MRILTAAASVLFGFSTAALAVGTSNWTHTTEADFKNGTFENVVATNLGDLKLSRAVKTLLEQDPQVSTVGALAEGPDGAVYAGTGPHGILLKIKGETVTRVATIEDATSINALSFDDKGRLLIATGGESGKVLRLEKATLEKAGDEEAVKKPEEVFAADGVQYVWQVRQTADGNLYVATGPTGQLYEVKPGGGKRVVLDSDENNLTALISDGRDMLYVGTDPNGLVYRVNRRTGDTFVLFDAPEAEISALVIDAKGYIYASTAEAKEEGSAAAAAAGEGGGRPEGGATGVPIKSDPPKAPEPPKLPDPNPGRPDPIPKAPPAAKPASSEREKPAGRAAVGLGHALFGLVRFDARFEEPKASSADAARPEPKNPKPNPPPVPPPGGAQPATNPSGQQRPAPGQQPVVSAGVAEPRPEGNAIYRIDHDGFVTEVFRQTVLILAMVERDGKLLIATGSEGQVYQVDPAAEETLVVARVEPKQIMSLLPAKDGRLYLGTANVGGIAAMSSGYAAKGTYISPVLDATQISRFGKMHLHGSLAEGAKATLATRSGNVQEAGEKGWSEWTAEAPVTEFFQIKSPSARFLQYRLTFASDGGASTPVIEDVNIAYQVPNLAPQVKSVKVTPATDATAQQANAEAGPAAQPPAGSKVAIAWEASDPNNDALQYAVSFRRGGPDAPWILLKDKLTEATYEWDTRSVADGRYEVRVTASDVAANVPGRGKTAARVSDPVDVDNTSPVIGDLRYDQHGAEIKVSFRAVDRTGVLASADYSVDSSKDWQAVLPTDSIWDSPEDAAEFTIAGLTPGVHQVTVRATDAKGNRAFESVFVKVQGPAAAK